MGGGVFPIPKPFVNSGEKTRVLGIWEVGTGSPIPKSKCKNGKILGFWGKPKVFPKGGGLGGSNVCEKFPNYPVFFLRAYLNSFVKFRGGRRVCKVYSRKVPKIVTRMHCCCIDSPRLLIHYERLILASHWLRDRSDYLTLEHPFPFFSVTYPDQRE